MKPGVTRSIQFFVGLLVTLVCSWLVLRHLEWGATWRILSVTNPWWLLLGLSFLAVGYGLRILRWGIMLQAILPGLPIRACAGPFLASVALNNVVPFRAGDLVRVVGFRRHLGLSAMPVLGTLLLERLLDLSALLVVFFVALQAAQGDRFPPEMMLTGGWLAAGCVTALALVTLMPRRFQAWAQAFAEFAGAKGWAAPTRLGRWATEFFSSLTLMQSPRRIGRLFGLSLGAWALEGGLFAAVAHGLHISDAGAGPWFALTTGTLGTLLPSTPGYVGTFDYLTMLGLTAFAVPEYQAAVFAVVVHLVLWLPLTLVGLIWLAVLKLHPTPAPAEPSRSVSVSA